MGTIWSWLVDAMSWVLAQFVTLYGQLFGLSSGWTWILAFVSIAVLMAALVAYPTRRQLETQRLAWEIGPAAIKIVRAYPHDKAKVVELRKKLYNHYGYQLRWQWLSLLNLIPLLTLNSVVTGLANDTAEGVFKWPKYAGYVDAAQHATIAHVPYPTGLRDAGSTPTPWWTVTVVLLLIAAMSLVNFQLQRQINGPTPSNKWVRRQQRILLLTTPFVYLATALVFDLAVGVIFYQLVVDLCNLGLQTVWLRRRPIPPVDLEWLQAFIDDLPAPPPKSGQPAPEH